MVKAPQINSESWLNGEQPEVKGQVVLYDFWTYSCVNCLRTIPSLKKLWQKYKYHGLVIIGIHTPEFEFEKDRENVEKAIKDLGVEWPVVMDNDLEIWHSFANKYWPSKYLTNKKGKIKYQHFGEGAYEQTEKAIQKLLFNKGDELPEISSAHEHSACFKPTPEKYLGYSRGTIVNLGGYYFDEDSNYMLEVDVPLHQIGLKGHFTATQEYIQSKDSHSEIVLHFHATEVNLVLEAVEEEAQIKVLFEDQALTEEVRGSDLDSGSVVRVKKSRLYNLLKSPTPVEGKLIIRGDKAEFKAYAFTFSGCS
jgi:thiol-disulfide isomerase/thioredoxin